MILACVEDTALLESNRSARQVAIQQGRENKLPALCISCPAGSPESEKLMSFGGKVGWLARDRLSGGHLRTLLLLLGARQTVG